MNEISQEKPAKTIIPDVGSVEPGTPLPVPEVISIQQQGTVPTVLRTGEFEIASDPIPDYKKHDATITLELPAEVKLLKPQRFKNYAKLHANKS